MPLTPGTRLGPYEVVDAIGAGGMGEVYKARDTRLDRTVALKVMPPALAGDPEFRARFEREARSISALNHPNICTLYDVGRQRPEGVTPDAGAEVDFLVMEYLEGETLAARLTKGSLPTDQALDYAMQIADALDKAHRQGIVHRDLKPANVFLVKSGAASGPAICKLLDFGLAKIGAIVTPGTLETRMAESFGTQAPKTAPLTSQGSILGTFQYMAPEQIEGQDADARTDIWGFGCVLYEMLTGRRAFEGRSQASLIASILERQPAPVAELQPLAPPALGRIVRTCLEKHPDNRFHTAHDLRLQLQWIEEGGSAAGVAAPVIVHRRRRERMMWLAITIGTLALGAAGAWFAKPAPPVENVIERFTFALPEGQAFSRTGRRYVAISPDGRRLAYIADQQIYLREMHQLSSQPVPGTSEDPLDLVFSPDGQWIAYFVPSGATGLNAPNAFTLKKIQIGGGTPVPLCQTGWPSGVSWAQGTIVFGQNSSAVRGVQSVPDTAGTPQTLVTVAATETATQPHLVDDGRLVLFTVRQNANASWDSADIVVQAPGETSRTVLVKGATDGRVIANDRLVYYRGGTIFGVGLDLDARAVRGGEVPVVEGVQSTTTGTGAGVFSVSSSGTLVFVPGTAEGNEVRRRLVWVDRTGKEEPIAAPERGYVHPRLSPDATRIVVAVEDASTASLFMWDLARQVFSRLTPAGDQQDLSPVWVLPDGRSVLYRSAMPDGAARIMRVDASGAAAPEQVADFGKGQAPLLESISPDGKTVFFRGGASGNSDVMTLALDGPDRTPRALLSGPEPENHARVSPDGRFLMYALNEAGGAQVFVRPYPDVSSNRWQVSAEAASDSVWARSGREIYFLSSGPDSQIFAVTVQPGPVFGRPVELFSNGPYTPAFRGGIDYDVAPDGRFLMVKRHGLDTSADRAASITIVTHWVDELRARVKSR